MQAKERGSWAGGWLERWFAAGLLVFLMVLAWLVRSEGLSLAPLSNDESFSWRMTTYSPAELLRHMPGDAHPPLYYLVLKGWTSACGASPVALRSLSVVFALASLAVLYAMCRDLGGRFERAPHGPSTDVSGALFAALLFAIHLAPMDEPSRSARMYSQGIFLTGLTSWLLLRALRCSRACSGLWLGYGLATAAFCYTHYYAFFTVAAQTAFLVGDLAVRARRDSLASVRTPLLGFSLAGVVALLLYVPWFPIWWKQASDVWRGFWIRPVTWETAQDLLFRWSSGLPRYHARAFPWWTLFLLACIVRTVWKADRGGLFCLVQASLPWLLSLAVSAWGGRPIFYERYLCFAQFFLFAFWGKVWDSLPHLVSRLGLGCLLCTLGICTRRA